MSVKLAREAFRNGRYGVALRRLCAYVDDLLEDVMRDTLSKLADDPDLQVAPA